MTHEVVITTKEVADFILFQKRMGITYHDFDEATLAYTETRKSLAEKMKGVTLGVPWTLDEEKRN